MPSTASPSDGGARTHQVRQHLGDRPALGLAVLVGRHDPRVQPERHVVDEDLAVDLAQVDGGFTGRPEHVECPDRIITVDPEVEGEMIARTGRDAHEWQSMRGRDRGHHRLGAVAAGHAQRIRAPGDRGLGQRLQVVARLEENGLDAPATGPRPRDAAA